MGFDYELGFENIGVSFIAALLCLMLSAGSDFIGLGIAGIVFQVFTAVFASICLISIVLMIYAFMFDIIENLEDKFMEAKANGKTKRNRRDKSEI